MQLNGNTRRINLPWTLTSKIWAFIVLLSTLGYAAAANPQPAAPSEKPAFSEIDAAHILDQLRQSLESHQRSRFLKLFDARRMPNYASFRDTIASLFDNYDSFQAQYHLNQVRMDGEFGALTSDFVLEAATPNATAPNMRRSVQMRLVCAWDGKRWKIVDLSPRSLFE